MSRKNTSRTFCCLFTILFIFCFVTVSCNTNKNITEEEPAVEAPEIITEPEEIITEEEPSVEEIISDEETQEEIPEEISGEEEILPEEIPEEITETIEEEISFQDEPEVLEEDVEAQEIPSIDKIKILFAGDIMDHQLNYEMDDYNEIYEAIKDDVLECDLALANIEAPVDDTRPFSTYPNFNMQQSYVEAAISAGFNVFSLVNNHTNDQGLEGMLETEKYFRKKEKETEYSERPVYACGIKRESKNPPLTYRLIESKGFKILFASVTEILNRGDYKYWMDFVAPTEDGRNKLITELLKIREQNPCDIFILGVHCAEPEYIRTVNKKQMEFYEKLLDNGIDVVWANHPHVAKDWFIYGDNENGQQKKIIFNALGNTISAQRRNPQFKAPETERDYTGDGFMIKVDFEKDEDSVYITNIEPVLITTYITPAWTFVIKKLDENLFEELEAQNRITWSKYLQERKKLMDYAKGNNVWQ